MFDKVCRASALSYIHHDSSVLNNSFLPTACDGHNARLVLADSPASLDSHVIQSILERKEESSGQHTLGDLGSNTCKTY